MSIISIRVKDDETKKALQKDIKILAAFRNQDASELIQDAVKLLKVKMNREIREYV